MCVHLNAPLPFDACLCELVLKGFTFSVCYNPLRRHRQVHITFSRAALPFKSEKPSRNLFENAKKTKNAKFSPKSRSSECRSVYWNCKLSNTPNLSYYYPKVNCGPCLSRRRSSFISIHRSRKKQSVCECATTRNPTRFPSLFVSSSLKRTRIALSLLVHSFAHFYHNTFGTSSLSLNSSIDFHSSVTTSHFFSTNFL